MYPILFALGFGLLKGARTRGTLSIPVNAAVTVTSYIQSWLGVISPGRNVSIRSCSLKHERRS